MARSYCAYDEDWQRRKSAQFRSIFHDIPILSPVEEESNDSSHDHHVTTQEVFPSPPRPYSPLPPLIIEIMPITNKHDEPEEHYIKLHKKIKEIYEKLFLEKRNLSSVDFDSNDNDCSVNDDGETEGTVENLVYESENNSPENGNFESIIEDRETRESSASTNSNGYGADFESMDTSVSSVDVVNRTVSNEDKIIISEEEESENVNVDDDRMRYEDIGNCRASENKAFSTEIMDNGAFSEKEESHHSTVNDQGTIESEESNETDIGQNYEAEGSDSEIKAGRNSNNQKSNWEEFERTSTGGINKLIASNDEPIEADVETSQSSEGPYYRQITTEALVHFDGYQDPGERESIVYEDSVKSIILPTSYRRMLASRNVDDTELEENADPKITATFDCDENETTEEDLEEVTTSHTSHSRQPDAIEEDDVEMRSRQSDYSEEVDTNQPGATYKGIEERSNLDSDDTEEENEGWHHTNDAGEDVGEVRTPGLDTIEEDDEEMRVHQSDYSEEVDTNQPGATYKGIEERSNLDSDDTEEENEGWHHTNDAGEDVGEMRTPGLDTIEEDDEEIRVRQSDYSEEVDTNQPGATYKGIEERSNLDSDDTEEENEGWHHTNDAGEDVGEMRTPGLDTIEEDDEEINSPQSIEVMRTPRPDLSHGTIPITQRSCSASTTENAALPQELAVLTSSSQDGIDNNMSERQTSHDMNEILTSIFNKSQNKDTTLISGTKRKLVEPVQAVETSRLTWEEMRANFFVGTPKIFRLCNCTDHICS